MTLHSPQPSAQLLADTYRTLAAMPGAASSEIARALGADTDETRSALHHMIRTGWAYCAPDGRWSAVRPC